MNRYFATFAVYVKPDLGLFVIDRSVITTDGEVATAEEIEAIESKFAKNNNRDVSLVALIGLVRMPI